MPKLTTMDAIETLARFIEHQAAKDLAESIGIPVVDDMAAQYCATREVFLRALLIGTTVSALIDHLDWPFETKSACREVLATLGQKDMAHMAEVRRRQKLLS
jgi:hypothetical protein